MLKLTTWTPVVIRRGPDGDAPRFDEAKAGKQFDVTQLIDLKGFEQWAKIAYPGHDEDLYICVTLPNGTKAASVSNMPEPDSDEFKRGWNACLDTVFQSLVPIRK